MFVTTFSVRCYPSCKFVLSSSPSPTVGQFHCKCVWLDAYRGFWRSAPCTLPLPHCFRRLACYAAATGSHARVAASGHATPRKPVTPRKSFRCTGRMDLRWTTCGRIFAPSCPRCLRGSRCRGRRSVQMLLPLDLLLPLLEGPLSTATTSGRWPALDTDQPTNRPTNRQTNGSALLFVQSQLQPLPLTVTRTRCSSACTSAAALSGCASPPTAARTRCTPRPCRCTRCTGSGSR